MVQIDNRRSKRLGTLAIVAAVATLVVSVGAVSSHAADGSYGGFDRYFHLDRLEIGPDHCVAAATINYDGVVSQMAAIRDEWLTTEKTTEFYQKHAVAIIFGVVDHKAGGVLLEVVYKQNKTKGPGKCHFSLSLAKADDFGQVKSYPQLSWDFNAALASRIIWDTFDDRNLRKIALNYEFTSDADRLLKEEDGEPAATADSSAHPKSCADIAASDVAEAFGNSPYAQSRHLRVLDATNPKPLPQRANQGFVCTSKLVTNAGALSVLVEPKLLSGQWYVSVKAIP